MAATKFSATAPDGTVGTRSSRTRIYTHARWIQFPWHPTQVIISWHMTEAAAETSPFQAPVWKTFQWGIVPVEVGA